MKNVRESEILQILQAQKNCTVAELIERLRVSPATVHRDITEMAQRGQLRKVHGGVMLPEAPAPSSQLIDSHFDARIHRNEDKKVRIAEQALRAISDGDTLFLDSSTTCLYLARAISKLTRLHLSIITNSVLIIQEFYRFPPHFSLHALGGNYQLQLNAFLGQAAIDQLRGLRFGKAFLSAFGFSSRGISTYHEEHARFLREVIGLAAENYLLIDSSKFGREGMFHISGPDVFRGVYSDQTLPKLPDADTGIGNG